MNYFEWNDLIARKFFNNEMAGREVLIYVNKETIEQLGVAAGADVEDFIQCIKVGPDWIENGGLCQKALKLFSNWRNYELEYPPYIAYLAFFVLAATIAGDFDRKAYYPRLWELLSRDSNSGSPRNFDHMALLWEDLEKWSTVDKNEELGRFVARIRGGWIHVGRPLSQTILSDDERKYLPLIFAEAELDPADTPSDIVIRRLLLNFGENKLQNRTLRLLNSAQEDDVILKALIEFVLEELTGWDGTVPDIIKPQDNVQSSRAVSGLSYVGLRVCLKLDSLSSKINSTLRLKTNRPFPDRGLNFEYGEQKISCFETVPPKWSTKLMTQHSQQFFDAASIDWTNGIRLEDKDKNWRVNLKGSDVKLFLPGEREVLTGWIESQRLERDCKFIIACHTSKVDTVYQWGLNSCQRFEQKQFQGLPGEWLVFEGEGAYKSCNNIDVLTLSSLLRIHIQGGIKTGRGNTYLEFAPPSIFLEGCQGGERILINGNEIKRKNISLPRWHLPDNIPVGHPQYIEVFGVDNQIPLQRRVIKLEEPKLSQSLDDAPCRDEIGNVIKTDIHIPFARGAIVEGIDSTLDNFPKILPTYMSENVIFLGSRPGEIIIWPDEGLPDKWQPVWAVVKTGKNKWIVYFCGELDYASVSRKRVKDERAVKHWKETIWVKRKKTKVPSIQKIKSIWNEYKEVARRV